MNIPRIYHRIYHTVERYLIDMITGAVPGNGACPSKCKAEMKSGFRVALGDSFCGAERAAPVPTGLQATAWRSFMCGRRAAVFAAAPFL